MLKTSGLAHIHILVRDLKKSLSFYGDVFGMKEQFREDDLVFIRTPGSQDLLTLHLSDDPLAGGGGGVNHFGFVLQDANDIEAAGDAVEAAGGKVLRRAEHAPGRPVLYCSDPDGYVVEIGS